MSGYKVWGNEVLFPEDVNDYLMGQAVPRFPDEAARSAELAAPEQGQLSYLVAENLLQLYDGSAWLTLATVPAGGTTGQVLAKASDTDFDVAWVTP